MIKKILLGLVAVIAIILVIASVKSDDMNVSRSTIVSAPPEAIFKVVNDFRQWDAWSPWSKLDPKMKKSFEGPSEGVGAIYRWSGNNEVGEGSTTLVASKPAEMIGMKLEFVRPFAGTSDVQFTFVPEGTGTKVTWAMQSKQPFLGKVAGLFIDCEKMCGDDFSKGLESLKETVEATPKP
ncbi:MAG: SRPBCC family protein [Verrucomicrobiales bacterium]|nr:SRPBCC family protein [Verrucomicrobiales bacterium]MCP5559829.1 SRPBCC family protein [Verrucomicrobiaceae bacterium]